MAIDKVFPMGSIIYLKGGNQKLMILNRGPQIKVDDEIKMFDYSATLYPAGLSLDKVIYFNTENIEEVLFEGYSDMDEDRFQELYQEWLETDGKNFPRGKVGPTLEN